MSIWKNARIGVRLAAGIGLVLVLLIAVAVAAYLGLSGGTHRTRVETHAITTVQAGAFALNGGDLILNGVDIGSLSVNDSSRTAVQNAQTLVDLINAKTGESGVRAAAITLPGGSFTTPGAGPLTGIALVNLDANARRGWQVPASGLPLDRPLYDIAIAGHGAGHFFLNDEVGC